MGLLAAIMLAVYLANPFGTASLDPRARLLGVALYKIPSRSMEPTLQQGDFILANAARYAFADPQVGDLVVFRFPPQRSIAYVKRIAGIPGDRVRIDGGRLYVNERPVTEPYLAQQALRQPDSLRMAERTVPAGRLHARRQPRQLQRQPLLGLRTARRPGRPGVRRLVCRGHPAHRFGALTPLRRTG